MALGLLAALHLCCQSAGGPGPDDATEQHALTLPPGVDPIVGVGTWGRATHYEMRVSAPEECFPRGKDRDPQLTRLGVDVTVHARGVLQIPANPYYALLIDGTNSVFEATLGGCEPALSPTLLEPGQTARGWISFDIPPGSAALKLAYAPALTNLSREELVFGLGR